MASYTSGAPSLAPGPLRRHSSEIRAACANERSCGSVRGRSEMIVPTATSIEERISAALSRTPKRPFSTKAGADEIKQTAGDRNRRAIAQFPGGVRSGDQDEEKSGRRQYRWQGIEPHPEGSRPVRFPASQQDDSHMLHKKLQDDADGDQRRDHVREVEETEEGRRRAQGQQRDVRKAFLRMELSEDAKVVAIERGGIGNARIAEQQRKDRGEGGPHHEHCDHPRRHDSKGPL